MPWESWIQVLVRRVTGMNEYWLRRRVVPRKLGRESQQVKEAYSLLDSLLYQLRLIHRFFNLPKEICAIL